MNTRHPSGNSDTESALESRLRELLTRRILMLDGAMGTMIQRYKLSEADFRGERFADHPVDVRGNNDLLSLTRPDVVREIHQAYLEAGADLIETNTFGATSIAQQDYGLAHVAYDINLEAAKIAKRHLRAVFDRREAALRRRRARSDAEDGVDLTDVNDPGARNITFDELVASYGEQARGLLDGGVDLLIVETIFDTLNAKAALFAIDEEFERRGARVPLMISGHGDRCIGPHPLGSNGRSVLELGAACTPADGWPELRTRRSADAAVHRRAGDASRHVHQRVPECRTAEPDVRNRLR